MTLLGAWPAQESSQDLALPQLTEHELVQVTLQVDPSAHVTLPLSPTVSVHVALSLHPTLQDFPHDPSHVEVASHESEQLPPWPQSASVNAHDVPAAQLQLAVPLQVGGGVPLPQAASHNTTKTFKPNKRDLIAPSYSATRAPSVMRGTQPDAPAPGERVATTAVAANL